MQDNYFTSIRCNHTTIRINNTIYERFYKTTGYFDADRYQPPPIIAQLFMIYIWIRNYYELSPRVCRADVKFDKYYGKALSNVLVRRNKNNFAFCGVQLRILQN